MDAFTADHVLQVNLREHLRVFVAEDQEERIGRTLMLLEDRMALLRERYRLSDQDLNLDLGPLGPLLPR